MTDVNTMTDDTKLPIAALVPLTDQDADQLLSQFADLLQIRGYRVRGLIQQRCPSGSGCKFSLRDLSTGKLYPISQDLGSQSTACVLDTAGIADASVVMRRIPDEGADLVIFNRFSGLESEGEGFAAEMLDLMILGIPVLTIVQDRHLMAWREFTGGLACELPAEGSAIEDWFATLVPQATHC